MKNLIKNQKYNQFLNIVIIYTIIIYDFNLIYS